MSIDLFVGLAQVVLSIVLVAVTWFYVRLTRSISGASSSAARAAEESARVSALTLEEMRQQRLDAYRPAMDVSVKGSRLVGMVPGSIEVVIANAGNGPALRVSVSLSLGGIYYVPRGEFQIPALLRQGATQRLTGTFETTNDKLPSDSELSGELVVSYRDLYGRELRCVNSLHFDPADAGSPWTVGAPTVEP